MEMGSWSAGPQHLNNKQLKLALFVDSDLNFHLWYSDTLPTQSFHGLVLSRLAGCLSSLDLHARASMQVETWLKLNGWFIKVVAGKPEEKCSFQFQPIMRRNSSRDDAILRLQIITSPKGKGCSQVVKRGNKSRSKDKGCRQPLAHVAQFRRVT